MCCLTLLVPAGQTSSWSTPHLQPTSPSTQGGGTCHRQPLRRAFTPRPPRLPPPPPLPFLQAPCPLQWLEIKQGKMELLIIKIKPLFHRCLELGKSLSESDGDMLISRIVLIWE